MRQSHFFIFVLILLMMTATVSIAQTVSVSGVVYEKNTAKIPFSVPEGKINVYLPDDMSVGDHITGTVIMEPSGKNQKQKERNLELLKQYTLSVGNMETNKDVGYILSDPPGETGKITGTFNFPDKWWGILNNAATLSLVRMKEPVAKVEMPIFQFNTGSGGPGQFKQVSGIKTEQEVVEYRPLKKIIAENDNLVLLNCGPRLSDVRQLDVPPILPPPPNITVWYIGHKVVIPLCSSPGQTIFAASAATTGKNTITAKDKNGNTVYTDEFYKVDINATIDKPNLRTKERTNLHVKVDGLKDCPYPLTMTIVNRAINTVLLDKGTHQTYSYDPFGDCDNNECSLMNITQGVTGVIPGPFDITANLILPNIAFGDVFHQQKSALKTPEDYNAWVDALKKDLKAYADKQGNDEVGRAAKANAERAIDNIPKCNDKSKLDECKAFADAYLRPVNIPKGAATMWVCGFEAYKAAIKAITATLGGKPELIDWEVIKNGLEFIRNMGEQLKDEALQNGATNAKKLVETIQKTGETKEKLEKLNEALESLTEKIDGKVSTDPSPFYAYTMNDLMISSHLSSIEGYRPADGSLISLNIADKATAGLYSVSQIAQRSYEMKISPGKSSDFQNLVNNFLSNKSLPENLNIIIPSSNNKASTIDFKNALIQEIEFPKMDANNKQPLPLTIKFKPEEVKYTIGEGKPKSTGTQQGKQWLPSNFKIEIGDLPCKKVNKVESFKITQKNVEDPIGSAKDYKIEPSKIVIPDLKFYIPESDIVPWKNWFSEYSKNNEVKNGTLIYEFGNLSPVLSIPLNELSPVNLIHSPADKTYEVIVRTAIKSGDPGLLDNPPIQFEQKPLDKPRHLEDKALQIGLHQAIKKLIADAGGARGQTWNTVCDNCRQCIEARMGTWAADLVKELGEGIIKEYLGKAVDLIGEAVKAVGAAKEFFDKISDKADNAEKLAEDIAEKIKAGELQVLELKPEMCKKNSYCLIKGTIFYNPKTGCVFAIIYCEGTQLCCPNVQTVITLTYCTNEEGMPKDLPDIDVIKK